MTQALDAQGYEDTTAPASDANPNANANPDSLSPEDTAIAQDDALTPNGDAGSDTSPFSNADTISDAVSVADTESEPDAVSDAVSVAKSDADTESDTESDAESESDADTESDATSDAVVDAGPKPECKLNSDCLVNKPCRVPICKADKCVLEIAADGEHCVDGVPCTQGHTCLKGVCYNQPKQCKAGSWCYVGVCDPKLDKCKDVPASKNKWCNDGNPCTGTDRCDGQGNCKGFPQADGTPCKGKTPCWLHRCKGGKCNKFQAKKCNDFNQCTYDYCGKAFNNCEFKMLGNGSACDDGIKCTVNDQCKWGTCWGEEKVKGCNGLPAGKCGDLKCGKTETGNSCPVDCNPKGLKDWLMFWGNCPKLVAACLGDKACLDAVNCMIDCKYPAGQGKKKEDVFECIKTKCQAKTEDAAWKKFEAVDKCAVALK